MKCLTLYLHSSAEGEALDCLRSQPLVSGFTLVACQGHSTSGGGGQEESAMDHVVGFVPRLRIEVILEDDHVAGVLESLKGCMGNHGSRGMWTLTPVLDWGSL